MTRTSELRSCRLCIKLGRFKYEESEMWLWICELKQLGFKQKSKRYFQCKRGHGLEIDSHISMFLWTRNGKGKNVTCYEVTEFHITIKRGGHNLHFYYHESAANEWQRGGHTSTNEIARLGYCAATLREHADLIARKFVANLNGKMV